jgi:hypothetical protein
LAIQGFSALGLVVGILVFIWLVDLRLWGTVALEAAKFVISIGVFVSFSYSSKKNGEESSVNQTLLLDYARRLAIIVSFLGDTALLGVLRTMTTLHGHKLIDVAFR